jgi:hypothetical protein
VDSTYVACALVASVCALPSEVALKTVPEFHANNQISYVIFDYPAPLIGHLMYLSSYLGKYVSGWIGRQTDR